MTAATWWWLAATLACLPRPRSPAAASARDGPGSLPLVLDLAAAALRAGQAVAAAFVVAAPAAPAALRAEIDRVVALLRAGAEASDAWAAVPASSQLGVVARVAGRSIVSGARLAHALEHAARELRRDSAARAEARAHRAGVLAAVPLALCFLPSFVCLGIVPAVVGLAGPALRGAL